MMQTKTFIDFNLNQYIQFRPNELTQGWLDAYNQRMFGHRWQQLGVKLRPDENGWCSMQGWEFMQVFGSSMSLAKSPVFHLGIRFAVEEPIIDTRT